MHDIASVDEGRESLLMNTCLLAGKIMLQSGAETARVEDTMLRIASHCGMRAHSFVTPTGIIFSSETSQTTRLVRIEERSTDIRKIVRVNQISRELASSSLSLDAAYAELQSVDETSDNYPILLRILFAGIASGCFLLMFGGTFGGVLPAAIAGAAGYSILWFLHRSVKLKFIAELVAAFAVGSLATGLVAVGIGHVLQSITIAAVMPLVPGILITNAVRDLMAGHLVSGLSKGADASLTAFAISAGIAFSITLFS